MEDGRTDESFTAVADQASVYTSPESNYDSAPNSQSPKPAVCETTTKPVPAITNGDGDVEAVDSSYANPSSAQLDTAASDAESATEGPNVSAELATEADADDEPAQKPANEVDLDQCRVCLSKADLVNIFSLGDENMRICDIVMTVCRVKILERDHLPNFLCFACVDKVTAALRFKNACETTDQELRSKLKRSKKTVRRSRGDFILVDCQMSSSEDDEDNHKDDGAAGSAKKTRRRIKRDKDDDDEFRISDGEAEEASVASESSDSSYTLKPSASGSKRVGRPRGRRPKKKKFATTVASPSGRKPSKGTKSSNYKHDVVYVDAAPQMSGASSDAAEVEDPDDDWADSKPPPPPLPTPKRGRGRPRKDASATPLKSTPVAPSAPKLAMTSSAKSTVSNSTPTSRIPHKKRALRNDDDSDEDYRAKEKKSPGSARKGHPCPYCDEVFATMDRLKEHKKKYIGQKPLTCTICGKSFKQRVSFDLHVSRHKEDTSKRCSACDLTFASRIELRRHEQTVHEKTFACDKCRRPFTSQARLDRHVESKCPGHMVSGASTPASGSAAKTYVKKVKREPEEGQAPMGKDLFKCVAPLTTTYWSDSFSD